MAVRLPLRASGQWEEPLPDPAHGEPRAHESGPTGVPAGGEPRGEQILLLLLDNAGWHRAKDLQVPPGVGLLHLPPYTPELSPAEPVVPLLREAVANEPLPSLEALEERVAQRWVYLQEHPEVIRGVAGFRWIPNE